MPTIELTDDGNIQITVPMSLRTFSGRKRIITPEDESTAPSRDEAVLNAFARAGYWQELLDSGHCATPGEIAKKLKIGQSYVARILRFNQLSPRIVRLFINGTAPNGLSLTKLLKKLPLNWDEQEQMLLN